MAVVKGRNGARDKKETRVKYVLLIMDTPNEPAAGHARVRRLVRRGRRLVREVGRDRQARRRAPAPGDRRRPRPIRSGAVTDGPFIETKEVLGGYSVIEADTIDEAVEIAKTWPGVDRGWITVEVRPVLEMG